jgi:creatinine amidohydrolase
MPLDTVFAAELTWDEFDKRVGKGETPILLPIGSMEQHGVHLPLNVDVLLPTEVSRQVAGRAGALVAPTFVYGYKSQQRAGGGNFFPGTVSLDGGTLVSQLRDVLRELARHGARRIALVNGHFENSWFLHEGIDLALRDIRYEGIRDMRVLLLSYWDFLDKKTIEGLYPDGDFAGVELEHAGVMETSMMLAAHPQLVRMDKVIDHKPAVFPTYDLYPPKQELTPKPGSLTSPRKATREKGETIFKVATAGIVEALKTEFGR